MRVTEDFFKIWQSETRRANTDFSNGELEKAAQKYLRLLDQVKQHLNTSPIANEYELKVLDCLVITYENLAETYQRQSLVNRADDTLEQALTDIEQIIAKTRSVGMKSAVFRRKSHLHTMKLMLK